MHRSKIQYVGGAMARRIAWLVAAGIALAIARVSPAHIAHGTVLLRLVYETDVLLPAFSANDRWGVELTPLGAVAMRRVPHQSRPSPRLSTAQVRGRSG